MAVQHGGTRVGVCIVRAETDASAGLLITVTVRRDVQDDTRESFRRAPTVEDALACVAEFLAAVAQDEP